MINSKRTVLALNDLHLNKLMAELIFKFELFEIIEDKKVVSVACPEKQFVSMGCLVLLGQ